MASQRWSVYLTRDFFKAAGFPDYRRADAFLGVVDGVSHSDALTAADREWPFYKRYGGKVFHARRVARPFAG